MYFRGNHFGKKHADNWIWPLAISSMCSTVMVFINGGFLYKAASKIRKYLREEGEIKDRINIKTLVIHSMAYGILIIGIVVFLILTLSYDIKDGANEKVTLISLIFLQVCNFIS